MKNEMRTLVPFFVVFLLLLLSSITNGTKRSNGGSLSPNGVSRILTEKAGESTPRTQTLRKLDIGNNGVGGEIRSSDGSSKVSRSSSSSSSSNANSALRFTSLASSKKKRKKFPRCGQFGFFGWNKAPVPVQKDSGCCPQEGYNEKTGASCNGHGACVPELKMDSFIEIDEQRVSSGETAKRSILIKLTLEEQQISLGSKWVELMEEAVRDSSACNVKLVKDYSNGKKCKKNAYGCVDDNAMDKMWVRDGCHGIFSNGDIKVRCAALIPGVYGECTIFPGFDCHPGQGENDKKKILNTLTVKKGREECSKHCKKDEDCVAFDYARGLERSNCRLYYVNNPRIAGREDIGGEDNYEYCVLPPHDRFKACGKTNVCGLCLCSAGWGGHGCEIDLTDSLEAENCSPLDPDCVNYVPEPPPCYGQTWEFAVDHPCRNPYREHVPRPPEAPPLINGETPSYQTDQKPEMWRPPEEDLENDDAPPPPPSE